MTKSEINTAMNIGQRFRNAEIAFNEAHKAVNELKFLGSYFVDAETKKELENWMIKLDQLKRNCDTYKCQHYIEQVMEKSLINS